MFFKLLVSNIGLKKICCLKCKQVFYYKTKFSCPECFFQKIKLSGRENIEKKFCLFFKAKGFKQKKPINLVPFWRTDVLFIQASIYPFQPTYTTGRISPLYNKIIISQPCVRMTDTDELGKDDTHLLLFNMLGQIVFNSQNVGYWVEQTITDNLEFLTKNLGIPLEKIVFKESVWEGGGNKGRCLEVYVGSLEIATFVFMTEEKKDGKYVDMKVQVVDVGYGLERLKYLFLGKPVYTLFFKKKLISKYPIKLLEFVRLSATLFSQNIHPSNKNAGGIHRQILKHIFQKISFFDDIFNLFMQILKQNKIKINFSPIFSIKDLLEKEYNRYSLILKKCLPQLKKLSQNNIDTKKLDLLFESEGCPIEEINKYFPTYTFHVQKKEQVQKIKNKIIVQKKYPLVQPNYISKIKKVGDKQYILYSDKIFPGGGGQEKDFAEIGGAQVLDISSDGAKNVYLLDKEIRGKYANVQVNTARRMILSRGHTLTHLLLAVLKKQLGSCIFQTGSLISESKCRLDVFFPFNLNPFYDSIREMVSKIIRSDAQVTQTMSNFNKLDFYNKPIFEPVQKNIVFCKKVNLINLKKIDVSACCGTHVHSLKQIGIYSFFEKITKIKENTWRIEYKIL